MEVWDGKSIDIFGVRRSIYSGNTFPKREKRKATGGDMYAL